MKFNFKKITSVLASAVMLGSTIGIAAAASYPAPFVSGGGADVAMVVGADAMSSDFLAAIDLGQNLQEELAKQTASTSGGTVATTTGEVAALFSGGTKIYVNDTLDVVKSVLTKSDLPTILEDESFSGNADATVTQTINVGSNPQITFAKQPTSSDDPSYGLTTSTTSSNYIYNATVTFSKAINFSHADSEGESIKLFGQTFTVGSATDGTNLVLLQSAEKAFLDSDNPSQDVTIAGASYTIELVSASDTAANIKVTDSSGNSESKEINEAQSKKVNGITVAVINADENNFKLSASVIAGSEKITLADNSAVTFGESDTYIDGTKVWFTGGGPANVVTKIVISVYALSLDKDAILA